ncbi:serine protease [Brevundimonas sp. EYE_349]|uniref:S1 family peptidase n=1 Tax=Brevundimonas sp. EYE_349 TaxID=2853455 RepID=UPI00200440CD|nr:serine protease [Brevundimonas sp. EYE_349]MCK6105457.1 serine protease [Brevundimonas sp. EYE_349]
MAVATVNLYDHRPSPEARTWDLPPWGHVLSKGVLPLFIRIGPRLMPIGTAYWLGGNAPFVMTALHCIAEALRHEPRYERFLAAGNLPASLDLTNCAFYVLHQDDCTADGGRITLIPLESVDAGPPGDVAFGFPRFEAGRTTWALPISFDPPRIGSTVWSLGYTDFEPKDGILLEDIQNGSFDWAKHYRHRFVVTEGTVEEIFTQRFTAGFTNGPCFAFDNAIAHGQSGGPIITPDGRVVGLNSATAENFFNRPMSLGSMFFPLLLNGVRASVTMGAPGASLTMKMRRPLIEMVLQGAIKSDGSETHVAIHDTPEGKAIGARIPRDDQPHAHADSPPFRPALPNNSSRNTGVSSPRKPRINHPPTRRKESAGDPVESVLEPGGFPFGPAVGPPATEKGFHGHLNRAADVAFAGFHFEDAGLKLVRRAGQPERARHGQWIPPQNLTGDFQFSGGSSHRDLVRPEAEQRAARPWRPGQKTNGDLAEAAVPIILPQDCSKGVANLSQAAPADRGCGACPPQADRRRRHARHRRLRA